VDLLGGIGGYDDDDDDHAPVVDDEPEDSAPPAATRDAMSHKIGGGALAALLADEGDQEPE